MNHSDTDRTLALAGIFQAAKLVQSAAYTGTTDTQPQMQSLQSVLALESVDVAGIYGGEAGVMVGLECLGQHLRGKANRDVEISRYAILLMHLAHKLMRQPEMLESIRRGIARASEQIVHYPLDHPNVIAGLADIYVNTISTLQPRILVNGEQEYLRNDDNANRIRALLLAGIRSAVLWFQTGGSRWRLLFQPTRYAREAERLLASLQRTHTEPVH